MDAIERIARVAGAAESTLTYLAEIARADYLTDADFRALASRELAAARRRIAELRGEPLTQS